MSVRETEAWLLELRRSRPWTEEEGRRVIEAWSRSGETVPAFARRVGLGAQRLYWWRVRLGRAGVGVIEAGTVSAPAPSFLPVVVRAASASTAGAGAPVTVCARGGVRVEVAALDAVSASWVAMLVRSLEEAPS
jgi:transposase-like protein